MSRILVIFDLDGTLVDSEALCSQAFIDLLPALNDTVSELVAQFRGMKLANILQAVERKLAGPLPDGFEVAYRQRVATLFASQLQPFDGVEAMLRALRHPCCIASSGPPEKIAQALALTGLSQYFGERVFSSYTVGKWKPDPGLFLHAAAALGYAPRECVVVEDSPIGLQAAAAAGMRALHFVPGMQSGDASGQFGQMADLHGLLDRLVAAMAAAG
ncbi:HAD-IA family hydrolase [Chitinimonas sp.]|uniref:HAD-IA family hydrolase n=1 Tax=Chitinimonas sp. TaxID=1934313 RepID=UPI0035AF700C